MAPKKSESKKKVSEPVPEVSPEPKEEDPITLDLIEKRARLTEEYFMQQVAKTIADNQAAAEAAAAAAEVEKAAEEEKQRQQAESEAWRQKMAEKREEVLARLDSLNRAKQEREKAKEKAQNLQKILCSGMRLPHVSKLLPVVVLYDADTVSFEERYFVRQLVKMLESGGIKVWWDFGQGYNKSPDRLWHRLQVANRAQVVVLVGSKGYFDSSDFEDEAALLYTRTVGGYKNGVSDFQVIHLLYDESPVPERWRTPMGRLSFTTCDPVALPPRLPSSDNWLERARVGASSLGNMFPHMLASKVAFFLSIASNSIASHIINAAKQRDTGEWLAAAKLHSKTQLHRFQMHPLAEWHREDLQLALSWLGEAMRPATQRLIEMGVDGWLLEVVDDQVLEQCGIAVPGHRAAILRVLDYYRDPSAKGGTMDPSVFSIYQLEGEAISEEVYKLFQAYDRDGDGVLNPREFKEVLQASRLELDPHELRAIMAEVDENENGTVDYDEFMPVMVGLIMGMKAKQSAAEEICRAESSLKVQAVKKVAGMTPEELNYKLRELFVRADRDNSGGLTRNEFLNCLKSDELGLSRQQVNMMMSEFDGDSDGVLTYEEFVPVAIDVLLESSKMSLEKERLTGKARGFELLISKALKRLEPSGLCKNGRVKTSVARAMLYCLAQERVIELGSVHVASLMDAADPNDRGMVNCTRFAFLAAKMIGAYFDSSDELSNSPLRRRESMIKKSRSWRALASREGKADGPQEGVRVDQRHSGSRQKDSRYPTFPFPKRPGSVEGPFAGNALFGTARPLSQADPRYSSKRPGSVPGPLPPIGSRPHSVLAFGGTESPTRPDRTLGKNPSP